MRCHDRPALAFAQFRPAADLQNVWVGAKARLIIAPLPFTCFARDLAARGLHALVYEIAYRTAKAAIWP
jgi:hypothetical protein